MSHGTSHVEASGLAHTLRHTFNVLVDIINYIHVFLIFERSGMFFEQRLLYFTKITNKNEKTFLKMNKEVGMLLPPKKELIQVE